MIVFSSLNSGAYLGRTYISDPGRNHSFDTLSYQESARIRESLAQPALQSAV